MSTGAVLTHGVSGFPTTGVPGDFDVQRRGYPFETPSNDPIRSYYGAQSHVLLPIHNYNEPWRATALDGNNWSMNALREGFYDETLFMAVPHGIKDQTIATIDYPEHLGIGYEQQLPLQRIHNSIDVPIHNQQNTEWQNGGANGDNKTFMPKTNVNVQPNVKYFQGAYVDQGVHPNSDIAGQQTTANTTRPDFKGGQTPFQKLPNGQTIGMLQPNEPPALWEMAPPPDPQVLPGEGTAPLRPTAPAWW